MKGGGVMQEITKFVGRKLGPTSVVMVGVHGNEFPGIVAMRKVLETVTVERGTVYFIVANPAAVKVRTRKIGFNLNRLFKEEGLLSHDQKQSPEGYRVKYLKQYLNKAVVLLDVHSSETKGSPPFVICEPNGFEIAKHLPFDMVVSGFDQVIPGGTDEYMNRKGRIGICVECGYLGDPATISLSQRAIEDFLVIMGHTLPSDEKPDRRTNQRRIRLTSIYHNKSAPFKLQKPWADFEKVRKGEMIGVDGEKPVLAEEDFLILFPDDCPTAGEEAFYIAQEI